MTTGTIIRSMGSLTFDAVFEESHSADLEVTEFPVETGGSISDHAFMKPLRLTISAGVSDIPLRTVPNDPYASESGRAARAYELLMLLQKTAEPFSVQTGLKLYTNMVCVSLNCSQDRLTASALHFTATLREVTIVSTQSVTYTPRKAGSTARQAGPKKNMGEQPGNNVTGQASLAKKLKNILTGVS